MPTSPEAAGRCGPRRGDDLYSNSAIVEEAVLAPLTDIFALPAWLPFHNVFSIGDVLIGVGVAMAIVVAMRRGASARVVLRGTSPNRERPRRTIGGWSRVDRATRFRDRDDDRPSLEELPRANPSRGGDAKPGISVSAAETARSPVPGRSGLTREWIVKANLGRFTTALALLATLALSLGAGRGGGSHEQRHRHPHDRGHSRSGHGPFRGTSLDRAHPGHVTALKPTTTADPAVVFDPGPRARSPGSPGLRVRKSRLDP